MDSASPLFELRVTAAKHVLGLTHSWEIPPVADRMLTQGVYSPALADLASLRRPIMSDVLPLFERTLDELRLSFQPRSEAAWLLARHCMERLMVEDERPLDVLYLLQCVSSAASDVLLDLDSFIGEYWSYADDGAIWSHTGQRWIANDAEGWVVFCKQLRQEARAWLDRHPKR